MQYARRGIYVDLDCVLDLRLGCLTLIDESFSIAVSSESAYYTRVQDVFSTPDHGELSLKVFKEVFSKLKPESVQISLGTKIWKFIKHLYLMLKKGYSHQGTESSIFVDVNVWPMVLTDQELTTLQASLKSCLNRQLPNFDVELHLVDIPRNKFNLWEAAKKYHGVVMYDYVQWIQSQETEFLKKKKVDDLILYLPRLFHNGLPTDPQAQLELKNGMDPFDAWERKFAPVLQINYLPISFFCADLPVNKDDLTELIQR